MSDTPLQSAGRVGTQSAGRVLQCSNVVIQYGWFYRDGNGINGQNLISPQGGPDIQNGPGYFDGTWCNFNIPNAIQGSAPNIWIVPNLTGIPKPGAAPGKVDPDTGLPYVLIAPGPLLLTFGADWQFVTVASFSASVGQDMAAQGYTGMFAVAQFANQNRGMSARFINPISAGIYQVFGFGIPAGKQVSWVWTFFFDSSDGTIKNAFPIGVQSTGLSTGQGGIREVLIGANSGKVFDLADKPLFSGNLDSRIIFGSAEPFFPAIIYDVVNPIIPPIPTAPGFGAVDKVYLAQFSQTAATDGQFVSL